MTHVYVLVPLAAVLATWSAYKRSSGTHLGPVGLLIFAYVATCTLAIPLEYLGQRWSVLEPALTPMLYLGASLGLVLWGFFPFRPSGFKYILIKNLPTYLLFERIVLVSSLATITFFSEPALRALSGHAGDNRANLSQFSEVLGSHGLLNTVFSLIANFFAVPICLALVRLTDNWPARHRSATVAWLLFGSSLSYLVYVLAYVGRDAAVFWPLTAAFHYLMFSQFLSPHRRRVMKRLAVAIVIFMAIPFVWISVARFGNDERGVVLSVLDYGGAQVRNFNDHYVAFSTPAYGALTFDQIRRLYTLAVEGVDQRTSRVDWFPVYTDTGVIPWSFSTFVGTFVQDFGPSRTPLLLVTLAFITRRSLAGLRGRGAMSMSQILVFSLCAQIVLFGVFYFRQMSSNLAMLAVFGSAGLLAVPGREPVAIGWASVLRRQRWPRGMVDRRSSL